MMWKGGRWVVMWKGGRWVTMGGRVCEDTHIRGGPVGRALDR